MILKTDVDGEIQHSHINSFTVTKTKVKVVGTNSTKEAEFTRTKSNGINLTFYADDMSTFIDMVMVEE